MSMSPVNTHAQEVPRGLLPATGELHKRIQSVAEAFDNLSRQLDPVMLSDETASPTIENLVGVPAPRWSEATGGVRQALDMLAGLEFRIRSVSDRLDIV